MSMTDTSDKTSYHALVVDNVRLVGYIINRLNVPVSLRQDAVQEGYLALCCAARAYNKNHSSKARFSTYAAVSIMHAICRFLKREAAWHKHHVLYHTFPASYRQQASTLEDETDRRLIGEMMKRIIEGQAAGLSLDKIAEQLHADTEFVMRLSRAIARMRGK